MKKIPAYLFFTVLLFSSTASFASRTVTGPKVTEGETSLESKSEYLVDGNDDVNGAWRERITVGHGFTSYWSSEIEAIALDHPGNDNKGTEFRSLQWRNRFQFLDQKPDGIDGGIRLGYAVDMTGDHADEIELKLLGGKDFGDFSHRANIIFTKEVGRDANTGADWGLSWSSRYKYSDEFQPGFELYDTFGRIGSQGSFDEQDHRMGPVFYGKFTNGISYDAGYLFGLSDGAPDGMVKAILKYTW